MSCKRVYRYIGILVLLPVLMALAACGKADKRMPLRHTEEPGMKKMTLDEEHVKNLGRTYYDGETVWLAQSGSGIEFVCQSELCVITLYKDNESSDYSELPRVAIYVDDQLVADEIIEVDSSDYELSFDANEAKGPHVIRVIKLSESKRSICGVSVEVDAFDIKPTPDKELKIEFVGDSITCGYGVEDDNPDNPFSTSTENVTKGYAYMTAEELGADYSIVSFSAYGVRTGHGQGGRDIPEEAVPRYYEKFGFCQYSFGAGTYAQDVEWDASRFDPDIVVINLGTNDTEWAIKSPEHINEFIQSYVDFLYQIRDIHPYANIVCALGMMGQTLCPSIDVAVDAYKSATGDDAVYTLRLNPMVEEDGYGANHHPSAVTHEKAKDQLVAFIKDNDLGRDYAKEYDE